MHTHQQSPDSSPQHKPDGEHPAPEPETNPAPRPAQAVVTQLLEQARRGDAGATNELFPIVYDELRQLAARFLHDERSAHTLQATALVHEAYLRLIGPEQSGQAWENRAHFFGAAAKAIRRILIDHARTRNRIKRGGLGVAPQDGAAAAQRLDLDESRLVTAAQPQTMIEFDSALTRLAQIDPQKARVIELRFFAGLSVEQTALALGTSASTVARDWQFARIWLYNELRQQVDGPPSRAKRPAP